MAPLDPQHARAAQFPCDNCPLPDRVARLEQAVYGDRAIGLPGVLPTLERLDKFAGEWTRFKWVMLGMAMASGVGSGALINVLLNAAKAVNP